jgi:hypothetical protein
METNFCQVNNPVTEALILEDLREGYDYSRKRIMAAASGTSEDGRE